MSTQYTTDSIITKELLNQIKPSPCFPGDTNGFKFIECKFNQSIHEYYANSYDREIQAIRFAIGTSDIGLTIRELLMKNGHERLAEQSASYTITI